MAAGAWVMGLGFVSMTWLLVAIAVVGANRPQYDMQLGENRNSKFWCSVKMNHWNGCLWLTPGIAGLATYNSGMVHYDGCRIPGSFDEPNAMVMQQLRFVPRSFSDGCRNDNNRDPRSNVTVLQRLMFETRSFSDGCNGGFKYNEQQGWSTEASGGDFLRDVFPRVNHFSSNSGRLNNVVCMGNLCSEMVFMSQEFHDFDQSNAGYFDIWSGNFEGFDHFQYNSGKFNIGDFIHGNFGSFNVNDLIQCNSGNLDRYNLIESNSGHINFFDHFQCGSGRFQYKSLGTACRSLTSIFMHWLVVQWHGRAGVFNAAQFHLDSWTDGTTVVGGIGQLQCISDCSQFGCKCVEGDNGSFFSYNWSDTMKIEDGYNQQLTMLANLRG